MSFGRATLCIRCCAEKEDGGEDEGKVGVECVVEREKKVRLAGRDKEEPPYKDGDQAAEHAAEEKSQTGQLI